MKSFKSTMHLYLPELIVSLVILSISLFIIKDGKFIFVFSALSICVLFALLALRFPTVPLYFLLILQFGTRVFDIFYDFSQFRPGGLQVKLTDPVYVIIFLTMLVAIFRDPGVVVVYWKHLRGGILLGLTFFLLIVLGYKEHGYSALAEFRFKYIALFIPFYCLSARLGTVEWVRFLRWAFWLSTLVVVPIVAISVLEGARPFSPSHRILNAQTHVWLVISLFLLMVPGLVRRGFSQILIAWLIGGSYLFLVLADAHRSIWLLSAAILITIWTLDRGDFRSLRLITAILCVTAVPLLVFVVLEGETTIAEFIISRINAYISPSEDPTASWRMQVWEAAWQVVKQNPIVGIGLGRYSEDVWSLLGQSNKIVGLHNFYLTIFFNGGVILAIIYGWYMSSLGRSFMKLRKDIPPYLYSFVVLGIAFLAGMLAFQLAYGVSEVLMLFTGVLLALLVSSIHDDRQVVQT